MGIMKSRRSGVALIVVLGLVAILMIVSVTFTIHMRVERAGAANLRHAAIARQVVKGGLAAALMAIDKQAGISAVPEWYDPDDVTAPTYKPFPNSKNVHGYLWRDTFISFDTNDTDNVNTWSHAQHTRNKKVSGTVSAPIFSSEVERYFPSGLAYRGYSSMHRLAHADNDDEWQPIIQPQWQPVFSDMENDNVMGRYAFFALDTTCMLDASCLTNASSARWMGRYPGEMDMSLPKQTRGLLSWNDWKDKKKVRGVLDAKAFTKKNLDNGTYETLAEFENMVNDSSSTKTVEDNVYFNTLSYDPGPTNADAIVYIGGSAEEIRKHKIEIIHAFYDSGLDDAADLSKNSDFKLPSGSPLKNDPKVSEQACWAYLGLVDYVDDDNVMEEDSDIGIAPSERPATERMPLVSGFFAVLTVEARHKRTKKEADVTWNETEPVQVKFKARVKVPFVFPFLPGSITKDEAQGLKIEGKAVLQANSKGGNSVSEKKKLNVPDVADVSECIVQTIKINEGENDGWFDVVKSKSGGNSMTVAEQLELPDVSAILRVGGATFRKDANGDDVIQHSFPAGKDNYGYLKNNKEVGFDEGMGMAVQIIGKQTKGQNPDKPDVWFDEDVQSKDPEETTDPETKVTTQTRFWNTNILVWAEIADPRFANKAMSAHADELDGDLLSSLFKASHIHNSLLGSDPRHSIPILKLRKNAPENVFSGFDEAEAFVNDFQKKNLSEDDIENGKNTAFGKTAPKEYDFGSYFSGQNGTVEGTSPFVAYLLKNPGAAEEFYGMPMDGMQKGAAAGNTDSAFVKHRMYVKNAPLESVGELGYLPVGMWQTIRLYDYCDGFGVPYYKDGKNVPEKERRRTHVDILRYGRLPKDNDVPQDPKNKNKDLDPYDGYFHPVLDYFTVVPDDEDVQGRVNVNALNKGILAAAFHSMPIATEINLKLKDAKEKARKICIDRAGNDAAPSLQDLPAFKYLAESIIQYREDSGRSFHNLSELAYLFGCGDFSGNPILHGAENGNVSYPVAAVANAAQNSQWGEFERESIIRNSCGLFTMRGQTFIVVVRGESYSPPYGRKKSMKGGTSNSSKTAVAQVWRDSHPENFDEVEDDIRVKKLSAKAAEKYRKEHYRFPMFVQFFKIIDD